MTQHTAGPWHLGTWNEYDGCYHLSGRDGLHVSVDGKQHESDARLIAAAPDAIHDAREVVGLAEDALRCLLDGALDLRSARGFLLAIQDRHRALLAKIEGKE